MAKRWDTECLTPGRWYTTRQVAALLGVAHAQVCNRATPKSRRPLPPEWITKRVLEERGPIVMITRLSASAIRKGLRDVQT